jgi:hypothetical protein
MAKVLYLSVTPEGLVSNWDDPIVRSSGAGDDERMVDLRLTPEQERLVWPPTLLEVLTRLSAFASERGTDENEGATDSLVRVIEAIDKELVAAGGVPPEVKD